VSDYFKSIASDFESGDDLIATSTNLFSNPCPRCDSSKPIEKLVLRQGVCYVYHLKPASKTDDAAVELSVTSTDTTDEIIRPDKPRWYVDFLPNVFLEKTSTKIEINQAYTIKVNAQKIILLESPDKCVNRKNYTQNNCFMDCVSDALNRKTGWHISLNSASLPTDLINQAGDSLPYPEDENRTIFNESLNECYKKCPIECERTVYDMSVYREEIPFPGEIKTPKGQTVSTVDLKFIHASLSQDAMLTFQEVETLTFSGFISNVGGTFGLFLGCTVMTLAQLTLSLINYMLDKRQPSGRGGDPQTDMAMT
jgi:hypothetical protein